MMDSNFDRDVQVNSAFSFYGSLATDALLDYVTPKVEEVINKQLYPAYSYARIYYQNAEMARHTDRPSCQYSVTVCLDIDEEYGPWEIWMKDYHGEETPVYLNPGDGIIYNGTKLEHWRTPYKGARQTQTFLHYVDANGPYASNRFDTRPFLGLGREWRDENKLIQKHADDE
jgi:hypothetical protein